MSPTDPNPSPATAPAPASPPKKRSVLAFLFKSALGCTAMAIGALIVLIAFAPALISRWVPSIAESWFSDTYHGELKIARAQLRWTGEQLLEGVALFDPQGKQVASATVRAPGLLSLLRGGGKHIGRVEIEAAAAIEADDAGVTDLDRALEPRDKPSEKLGKPDERSSTARLYELDLDLDVHVSELSWSDANTRALGLPISVKDLKAQVRATPGEALTIALNGALSGAVESARPAALKLEARVERLFEPWGSNGPQRVHVDAEIIGLPTGLIDTLAGMHGRLVDALGTSFALDAKVDGNLAKGDVDARVEFPRGGLSMIGHVHDGVFESSDTEGLAGDIEPGARLIDSLLAQYLPGAKLERREKVKGERIRLTVQPLVVPIAPLLAARDPGAPLPIAKVLEGIQADCKVELGGWRYADATLVAAGQGLELDGVELKATVEPAEGRTRLHASFYSNLAGPTPGVVHAEVLAGDLAALANYATEKALEPVDLSATVHEFPVAVIDALAQQKGELVRALGERISLELRANPKLAAVPAPAASDWRSLARRVACDATLSMTGSGAPQPSALTGGEALGLKSLSARIKLAPDAPIAIDVTGELASKQKGSIVAQARVTNALADPGARLPLGVQMDAQLTGFPTAVVDALAAQNGRVTQLLGDSFDVKAKADGTLEAGDARVDLTSSLAQIALAGHFANGVLESANGPALTATLQPTREFLDFYLVPLLPQGTELSFNESRGHVTCSVDSLRVPVDELLALADQGTDVMIPAVVSKMRVQATFDVGELRYQDAALRAKKAALDGIKVHAAVDLQPTPQASALTCDLTLDSRSVASKPIDVHFAARDARELLLLAKGGEFTDVKLTVAATGLSTRVLEALAGQEAQVSAALGESIDVTAAVGAEQAKNKPLAVDMSIDMKSKSGATKVVAAAKVMQPFAQRAPGELPPVEASVKVTGTGAVLAFAPAEIAKMAAPLLGDELDASVKHVQSGPGASDVTLDLRAAKVALMGAAQYSNQTLVATGDRQLALRIDVPPEVLAQLTAGKLPPGAGVAIPPDAGSIEMHLKELRAPLAGFFAEDTSHALEALVQGLDAQLALAFPRVEYTHPPAAPGTNATPVALRDLAVTASFAHGAPAKVRATGAVDATPPGAIDVTATLEHPEGFLAAGGPAGGASATLQGKLTHIPTALVDAVAAQQGLLVDVLGPELEVDVSGRYPDSGTQPLHAEMHSNLGHVTVAARMEKSVLRADKPEEGIDASVGLTPLFSERIVGKLVPVLFHVSKAAGEDPAVLKAHSFSMPLSGDLSQLSGEILLDLGVVDYQLLPGLTQALEIAGASTSMKSTRLAPVTIRIDKGIARYDKLPVKIGGRELAFRGSYDLAHSTFNLALDVPLEMLGHKVEQQLESVRQYLDPKLVVPLEISGTWSSPKLRLGKEFLDKVLKDAAGGALEKGLGELLGGKKKKNKDG